MGDTAYRKYQSLVTLLIWLNTEYTPTFLNLHLHLHLVVLQLQGCYCFSVIIMVCICANNVTIVAGISYNFLLS